MTDPLTHESDDRDPAQRQPPIDEGAAALSTVLSRLADHPGPSVTLDELVRQFGARAFGALLFIFAVPNLLPLPPGSSTVLGAPLLLIGPQLAVGAAEPWLPKGVARQTIRTSVLADVCRRALPWVLKAERLSSRRLAALFGGPGHLIVGIVCTLLAMVLVLPIPLGNMLPALAIVVLGLSLTQRDGVLALAGYAIASVSAGVLLLSGHMIVQGVARLGAWISG